VAESSQKNASASAGKSSSSSGKVIMKNYSRQGSFLFPMILDSRYFMISCL
jgi:hypothetical protein